jgi:hypothetical protein
MQACSPASFASEYTNWGFHVLCALPVTAEEAETSVARLAVFRHGQLHHRGGAHATMLVPKTLTGADQFRQFLEFRLEKPIRPELWQVGEGGVGEREREGL